MGATRRTGKIDGIDSEAVSAFLSAAFARSPLGMAFLDPGLIVRAANDSLTRRLRLPLEEILGRAGAELLPGWSEEVARAFLEVRRTGEPFGAEPHSGAGKGQLGRCIPLWDFSISPALGSGGSFQGYLLVQGEADVRHEQEHQARLATLVRISEGVLAESTVEGLLRRVVAGGRELTGARMAVAGYGCLDSRFRLTVASQPEGDPPNPALARLASGRGGFHLDLVRETPSVRLSREQLLALTAVWGLPESHGELRGLLAARLAGSGGTVDGLIMVSDSEGGAEFTEEDEALLVQFAGLASLALQQIEVREETERRALELDTVISSIADGIIVYDPQGRIVRINAAARRLLGFTPEEWELSVEERGRLIGIRSLDGSPLPAEEMPANVALRGETVRGVVLLVHRPPDRDRWVSTSAAPVMGGYGRLLGAVMSYTDVTALYDLQRQRDQHVLGISHGLRTPLTMVQGHAQLLAKALEKAGAGHQARMNVRAIMAGSRRMGLVLRDLVDLTELESGKPLWLNREKLDLGSFMHRLMDRMEYVLPMERVGAEIESGLPTVNADSSRLESVMTNLLSNALKYSDGPVYVRARRVGSEIEVEVADRGDGITPDRLPLLFQPPYRRRSAGTPQASLGLGLFVAKGLVEAHGGRMWVKSEVDKGSSFFFALPLSAAK